MDKMTEKDMAVLEEIKKDALAAIVHAECFVLISIIDEDVRLIRGVREGRQKLTMVGAAALAIATMNNETLAEGGVQYTDRRKLN